MSIENTIKNLKIWKDNISIEKITGGITNQNFLVHEGNKKFFVRIGNDIPEHLIFRQNEISCSKAASLADIAPKLIHSAEGIIVFEYNNDASDFPFTMSAHTITKEYVTQIAKQK